MKEIKYLILFLFLLILSSKSIGQNLQNADSVAHDTVTNDDIFAMQTFSSGTYPWKQMSWWALANGVQTRLELLPMTWSAAQIFADPTSFFDINSIQFLLPVTNLVISFVGVASRPYDNMYANNFVFINNSAGTDSTYSDSSFVYYDSTLAKVVFDKKIAARGIELFKTDGTDSTDILYDGTNIIFAKPLAIGKGMSMDSASTFNVFNFTPHTYTIPVEDAGDTILTLTTSDLYSSIKLELGGNVTPGISFLQIDTATEGMILRFYNNDASFTVIFKDIVSGDDNMYMEGDITLGQYDNIAFECADATKQAQVWMELRRKDN